MIGLRHVKMLQLLNMVDVGEDTGMDFKKGKIESDPLEVVSFVTDQLEGHGRIHG